MKGYDFIERSCENFSKKKKRSFEFSEITFLAILYDILWGHILSVLHQVPTNLFKYETLLKNFFLM